MKILHVIDSAGLYGAEQVLLSLCREQQALGMQPIIASLGTAAAGIKPLETEARRRGIRVEAFTLRAGPNYPGALTILRFAWREGVDLLHSHGYRGNFLLGTLPRPVRRLPLLATVHGYTSLHRWTRMRIYEWLDARLLRFLDAVVLVDSSIRSHPRFRGVGPFPFRVVPNGIGPAPEGPEGEAPDPALRTFCRDGFTVCAIGRLTPGKGFDVLLRAMAQAVRNGAEIRLVIFGEGGERGRLEGLAAEAGVAERVLLPGYFPEVRRHLGLFQAFVLSSWTEGLPMTVLEAMQAEVPVLATRVGAVPEVLEEGRAGVLVHPGAADEMSAGLLALSRDPALGRRLAERGGQRVRELYSSSRMALQYRDTYLDLLTAKGVAHAS